MLRRYAAIVCFLVAGASVAYAAQHAIGQKGRLFSPGAVHVRAGDTLMFRNDDTVTHHIYSSTKGQEFELQNTRPGQDVTRAFPTRGRVEVRCGLHPGMRLVVTVD